MNKNQTAVEWLAKKLDNLLELYPSEWEKVNELIEQAKEMAKEQIIDAHFQGGKKAIMIVNNYINVPKTMKNISDIENGSLRYDDGYDYYNETFKTE